MSNNKELTVFAVGSVFYQMVGYGYTLSHELIHAFDLQFNMPNWTLEYGRNSSGNRFTDLQAIREKRAYDYNKGQGMKLIGPQIEGYNNFKDIIKNSRNLQNNMSNFKIINPWR